MNLDMAQDFVASAGEKPRRERKRKRINTESSKQAERTAFLHGIKAERLRIQGSNGVFYFCEGKCGSHFATFEEAWDVLTVSHIEPRNDTSTRYERRREPDFRGDDPRNILLECIPCNQKREPEPEWSNA